MTLDDPSNFEIGILIPLLLLLGSILISLSVISPSSPVLGVGFGNVVPLETGGRGENFRLETIASLKNRLVPLVFE